MCDRQDQSIALHNIKLNLEMKTITLNGQIIANTDDNGMLKYNKYEDIHEEVQDLMTNWLKKKTRHHDCDQSWKRDEKKMQQRGNDYE